MLTKLPVYAAARTFGKTPPLPFNYTFITTGFCNSRCLTCDIWLRDKPQLNDLTLDEWIRTFESVGQSPFWATLSGGEPFYRKDLVEMHDALVSICKPKIINIPTNSLTKRVIESVWEMCIRHPETNLIINVSLDHCDPEKNDVIRGVKGNFKKSIQTFEDLKKLGFPNLNVGIHTVISKYNVDDMNEIADFFMDKAPDQFITEVAERRVELATTEHDITPPPEQYEKAVRYIQEKMRNSGHWGGISRLTKGFRLTYYNNAVKNLYELKQAIPCYAGYASVQIDHDGDVWPCCVEAVDLGNLRENDFDFPKIWQGAMAKKARERIRKGECQCPLANASYSNMLMHPLSLAKVVREVVT
jgi:MoaA/NifB/PqqE/SkfB family radical SAM enzyme